MARWNGLSTHLLFFFIASAYAGNSPAASPGVCRAADLPGRWVMTQLEIKRKDLPWGGGPQTFRYQEKIFYVNGTVHQLVSGEPITPKIERRLKESSPVRFKVEKDGWVLIQTKGRMELDRYLCEKLPDGGIHLTWEYQGKPSLEQTLHK